MCGIFGLISTDPIDAFPDGLMAATHRLRHRGPDDWGVVLFVPRDSYRISVHDDLDIRTRVEPSSSSPPRATASLGSAARAASPRDARRAAARWWFAGRRPSAPCAAGRWPARTAARCVCRTRSARTAAFTKAARSSRSRRKRNRNRDFPRFPRARIWVVTNMTRLCFKSRPLALSGVTLSLSKGNEDEA